MFWGPYVECFSSSTVAHGPMAKPEIRTSLWPRAKNSMYGPQNIKYYYNIKPQQSTIIRKIKWNKHIQIYGFYFYAREFHNLISLNFDSIDCRICSSQICKNCTWHHWITTIKIIITTIKQYTQDHTWVLFF